MKTVDTIGRRDGRSNDRDGSTSGRKSDLGTETNRTDPCTVTRKYPFGGYNGWWEIMIGILEKMSSGESCVMMMMMFDFVFYDGV